MLSVAAFWGVQGMTPTRLKTARELHARRMAYELDLPWCVLEPGGAHAEQAFQS